MTRSDATTTSFLSPGLKDYICGTCSGFGKVIAGYPFDTIKGRVQTGHFRSSYECITRTLRHEGPLAFYQGVSVPTVNVCFVGGILFYFNGLIRSMLQEDVSVPLTYTEMALAGGGSGFVVGIVVTPMEVAKVRLQVLNKRNATESRSPASLAQLLRTLRPIDFFAGATPTLLREVGTFGIFFPTNEYLRRQLSWFKDGRDLSVPGETAKFSTKVLAAGTAGVIGWFPLFPVDQVKSRMQVLPACSYASWLSCARKVYLEEGVAKGFFRGIEPCLIRAFPAYAAQYLLYEQLVNTL